MRRASYHSPAAYLASAFSSGLSYEVCRYLHHSVGLYNNLVDLTDSLTSDFVDNSCSSTTQKFLSNRIEDCQFRKLFNNSTPMDRAHLLSISSPHASASLSVTPSPSIGLHLEPSEFQVAIKWWLGIPVALLDKISLDSHASSNINQKILSSKLDDYQLQGIFNRSSVADRARLLSISAPHSSAWLSVVPSEGLGLYFEPNQYNVTLKWWLGLDTSCGSICAFCPDSILDPLGHHASTCK